MWQNPFEKSITGCPCGCGVDLLLGSFDQPAGAKGKQCHYLKCKDQFIYGQKMFVAVRKKHGRQGKDASPHQQPTTFIKQFASLADAVHLLRTRNRKLTNSNISQYQKKSRCKTKVQPGNKIRIEVRKLCATRIELAIRGRKKSYPHCTAPRHIGPDIFPLAISRIGNQKERNCTQKPYKHITGNGILIMTDGFLNMKTLSNKCGDKR